MSDADRNEDEFDPILIELKEELSRDFDKKISREIEKFEGKLKQFISLFRWSSGLLVSLVLTIVALGWMIIQDRAPADAKQKIDGLSVHSCRALVHGVDARQKLLADERRNMEGQVQQLERQLGNLPSHSNYLANRISQLEATVLEQRDAIDGIKADLGSEDREAARYALQTDLETVQAQYEPNYQELNRLRLEFSQIPQTESDWESNLTTLKARLGAAEAESANLATESAECRGRMGQP
ncbi:MAG: hypothetical protein QNJ09_00635 [Paracoccaceae bacterium]|nr:hypothetical protein [Paracoccaceae bacterium]